MKSFFESRLRRRAAMTAVALASSAAVAVSGAPSAKASADGWTYFAAASVPTPWGDVHVPGGQLFHSIKGGGRHIEWQGADFITAGNICNWRIDFLYYDMNGRRDDTSYGPTHYQCNRVGIRKDTINRDVRYGTACAKLLVNGTPVPGAKQCHSITTPKRWPW